MNFRYFAFIYALLAVVACDATGTQSPAAKSTATPNQNTDSSTDTSAIVATVNGQPISEADLDLYLEQHRAFNPVKALVPERSAALEEIIGLELARQDGEQKGLQDTPQVALQIAQQRRAVIASTAIKAAMAAEAISEEDLLKIYQVQIGNGRETKARHIVVASEDDAVKIIAQLNDGDDFSELAAQSSSGPTASSGGDLGWFSSKQMAAPINDAIADLSKGQYTQEPVATTTGWQIIVVDDIRESEPTFEQIKSELKMRLQNERAQAYISELRSRAEVDVKLSGKPENSTR